MQLSKSVDFNLLFNIRRFPPYPWQLFIRSSANPPQCHPPLPPNEDERSVFRRALAALRAARSKKRTAHLVLPFCSKARQAAQLLFFRRDRQGARRKNKSCDDLPLERGGRLNGWTVFRALFISPVTDQPKTDASRQLSDPDGFWFSDNFGETEYRSAASFADSSSNAKKMALFFLALIHQTPHSEGPSATISF